MALLADGTRRDCGTCAKSTPARAQPQEYARVRGLSAREISAAGKVHCRSRKCRSSHRCADLGLCAAALSYAGPDAIAACTSFSKPAILAITAAGKPCRCCQYSGVLNDTQPRFPSFFPAATVTAS